MKGGNKFIIWSEASTMYYQRNLAQCVWGMILIILLLIGIYSAKTFNFDTAYSVLVILPVFLCALFLNKKLFYEQKILVRRQLKILQVWKMKEKGIRSEGWQREEDIKDIESAIREVQQKNTAFS